MMSLATIRSLSRKQAYRAARERKVPFVPEPSDIQAWRENRGRIQIPNLGCHHPKGWTRLDDRWMFVDKTGMGDPGEPALTVDQFLGRLARLREEHPDWGYAIVEEGEFQLYVAPFRPVKRRTYHEV